MFWFTTSDADSSLVTGQQYGYAFDMIGNRISKSFNDQTESYTANVLNQYSSRTVPGAIWDLGSANSNATVTVNNLATTRKGMYFAGTVPVNNNASTIYTQLLTVGVLKNAGTNSMNIVSTQTGQVFVAQSPEPFSYDLDGNLTADGRWSYTWDAENRLISVVTQASLPASVPRIKLLFAYDYQNRRVSKVVSNYTGGAWVATSNLKFVYDGWNLLAELNQTNAVLRSYAWGLDLSGSQQGAGGIGGLLWMSNQSSNSFVAYDGNGNVTSLLNTENSQLNTSYEYGPFGELIRATGTSAANNPFRFSTKYQDAETGLYYYGERYYNASTGRWLSRDPIGEMGFSLMAKKRNFRLKLWQKNSNQNAGANLFRGNYDYIFTLNNPVRLYDLVGLDCPGCDAPWGSTSSMPVHDPHHLRCCAQHDRCYDVNHCDFSSWGSTIAKLITYHAMMANWMANPVGPMPVEPSYTACEQCNITVLSCWIGKDPGGEQYYCARQHTFIHIGPGKSDLPTYPTLDEAKGCCCTGKTSPPPEEPRSGNIYIPVHDGGATFEVINWSGFFGYN